MKKIIKFSHAFLPAALVSIAVIVTGLAGYFLKGGFNLGVDFQAGFVQEVRIAPTAFTLTYSGKGDATINFTREGLAVVISGANVDGVTHSFPFARYPALSELRAAMEEAIAGLHFDLRAADNVRSEYVIQSAHGAPQLDAEEAFVVHYLEPDAPAIPIDDVRAALASVDVAAIQSIGSPSDRHFLIRVDASAPEPVVLPPAVPPEEAAVADAAAPPDEAAVPTEAAAAAPDEAAVPENAASLERDISGLLEQAFGEGSVAVIRSDYVGSRFSKHLASQAGFLLGLTLLLILLYASFRFKPQFAIGAVLAIAHDALIMTAFIAWSRLEFNTTTIAAILTILGYSINDTIVIFDRVRETRLLYPDDSFKNVLNRAITETLGRTIITTLTTMLAVLSLYIFTTQALYQSGISTAAKVMYVFAEHNNMKDFALILLIGMLSGVYSTIYIACGWTMFWEKNIKKRKAGASV